MDLLKGNLSDDFVSQLSNQIGADEDQTEAAATGVMSTLVSALARNASTEQGASALSNALDRDHDGGILNDIFGMLTGNNQPQNPRTVNGAGILNHILGDRQSGAIDMISKLSGLDQSKTGNLMTMLAPVIMGALGKAKQSNGLDAAGIASLLSGTVSQNQQNNPQMGFIGKFLDSDGDGSYMDDVANIGLKLLGGFFNRKR